MKALLLAAGASLALAVRRDSPHVSSQVTHDGHHVSWGNTLPEDIGFEVELVFGSLVNAICGLRWSTKGSRRSRRASNIQVSS